MPKVYRFVFVATTVETFLTIFHFTELVVSSKPISDAYVRYMFLMDPCTVYTFYRHLYGYFYNIFVLTDIKVLLFIIRRKFCHNVCRQSSSHFRRRIFCTLIGYHFYCKKTPQRCSQINFTVHKSLFNDSKSIWDLILVSHDYLNSPKFAVRRRGLYSKWATINKCARNSRRWSLC